MLVSISCARRETSAVTSALSTAPGGWQLLWQVGPSERAYAPLAYDVDDEVLLVFGGLASSTGPAYQDTWEWSEGFAAWQERTPVGAVPPSRYAHGTAYDTVRKKTLLFGGVTFNNGLFNDLWEWDSPTGTWTERVITGLQPSPRYAAGMVWDSARQRAVIFGGVGPNSVYLNDLWEWDGTTGTWTNPAPGGTQPTARAYHTMVYDSARQKVVVYGGTDGTNSFDETWEWDGAAQKWTQGPAIGSSGHNTPSPTQIDDVGITYAAMAFDSSRGKIVMYTNTDVSPSDQSRRVWEYAPLATPPGWTAIATTVAGVATGPYPGGFAYQADRNVLVAYDAGGNLWDYDPVSAVWTNRLPSGPLERSYSAIVYDSRASEVRVFGGTTCCGAAYSVLQDLWSWPHPAGDWNEGNWDNLTNANSPGPSGQYNAGVAAYDSKRDQLLILVSSGTGTATVWTWTSSTDSWAQTPATVPATGPIPNTGGAGFPTFYDRARDEVVIFGNQVWELDPATATLVVRGAVPASPGVAELPQVAYDPDRSVAYFFNVDTKGTVRQWDAKTNTSSDWTPPVSGAGPALRVGEAVVFDPNRRVVIMMGGSTPRVVDGGVATGGTPLNDTWEWDPVSGAWTNTTDSTTLPSPLSLIALRYDLVNARALVFRGSLSSILPFDYMLDQIWEYRGPAVPIDGGVGIAPDSGTGGTGGARADGGGLDAGPTQTGAGGTGGGLDAGPIQTGAGGTGGGLDAGPIQTGAGGTGGGLDAGPIQTGAGGTGGGVGTVPDGGPGGTEGATRDGGGLDARPGQTGAGGGGGAVVDGGGGRSTSDASVASGMTGGAGGLGHRDAASDHDGIAGSSGAPADGGTGRSDSGCNCVAEGSSGRVSVVDLLLAALVLSRLRSRPRRPREVTGSAS